MGTVEFDKQNKTQLVLHMEDMFDANQIVGLSDYIGLLQNNGNRRAKVRVLGNHNLFEIAMNYKLL